MASVRSKSQVTAQAAPADSAPAYSGDYDPSPQAFLREEYNRTHPKKNPAAVPHIRAGSAHAVAEPRAHHGAVPRAAAPVAAHAAEQPGMLSRFFSSASSFTDHASVSTAHTWNAACESYHGWVHRCVEMFASHIRAIGCSCADVENILMRMMNTESHGDPNCSYGGCEGLMQMNPTTMQSMIRKYGLSCSSNPFDAQANIMCATAYYVDTLKMFDGSYRKACAGYNWGPYRDVIRQGNEQGYRRVTQEYVEKAMALPAGSITSHGSTYAAAHQTHRRHHGHSHHKHVKKA